MRVLKIGADWCAGCLVMKPRWAEIERKNSWLKTQYIDYDKDKKKLKKYNIKSDFLPVFIFLNKQGLEIDRRTGEVEKGQLIELITKYKDK
jgi:thiol-disulfide isomerase/thioredoxin